MTYADVCFHHYHTAILLFSDVVSHANDTGGRHIGPVDYK